MAQTEYDQWQEEQEFNEEFNGHGTDAPDAPGYDDTEEKVQQRYDILRHLAAQCFLPDVKPTTQ